jgi:hypothetical protein
MAWRRDGVIFDIISKKIMKIDSENSSHPSYDMFFRRVLSQTAHRIMEICDRLCLAENIKEDIWNAIKYLLSEKTEMLLIDRHLD